MTRSHLTQEFLNYFDDSDRRVREELHRPAIASVMTNMKKIFLLLFAAITVWAQAPAPLFLPRSPLGST
jgi:hypothetical protein